MATSHENRQFIYGNIWQCRLSIYKICQKALLFLSAIKRHWNFKPIFALLIFSGAREIQGFFNKYDTLLSLNFVKTSSLSVFSLFCTKQISGWHRLERTRENIVYLCLLARQNEPKTFTESELEKKYRKRKYKTLSDFFWWHWFIVTHYALPH